jgi:hypothetical protein
MFGSDTRYGSSPSYHGRRTMAGSAVPAHSTSIRSILTAPGSCSRATARSCHFRDGLLPAAATRCRSSRFAPAGSPLHRSACSSTAADQPSSGRIGVIFRDPLAGSTGDSDSSRFLILVRSLASIGPCALTAATSAPTASSRPGSPGSSHQTAKADAAFIAAREPQVCGMPAAVRTAHAASAAGTTSRRRPSTRSRFDIR